MGKCSYYLMKGDNYSIEAENVACAGAISEVRCLFVDKVIYYFFGLVYPCCAWQQCRPNTLYSLHNNSPSFYTMLYCSALAIVYGHFRQFVKNFDKHVRHRVPFVLRKMNIGISLCFH